MNEREIDHYIDRAYQYLRQGNAKAALEAMRHVLSFEPEHAGAHAMLAVVLLDMKRLHAAEHEAGRALLEDPELPAAHYTMALVAMARRDLDRAGEHVDTLLALEPDDPVNYHLQADYLEQRGRLDDAQAALEHALELAPDDPDLLNALGLLHHERGRHDQAARLCGEALSVDPEHLGAHTLRGWLDLGDGEVAAAYEHACFVLGNDPTDRSAIRLLVAIKVRRNVLLGSWWRFNAWLESLDDRQQMLATLGSFLAYRVLTVVLKHRGLEDVAELLQWAWLGICAYTWAGPAMFQRWLAQELGQVELRDDY